MQAPLEIRYAGVIVGRAQELRGAEGDAPSFFIPVRDPMPVGTVLRLRSGDQETPVRVVRAVEAADAAASGMQVRTIGEAEVVAFEFIPPPAMVPEKAKPVAPAPAIESDAKGMEAEGSQVGSAAREATPVVDAGLAPVQEIAPAEVVAPAAPSEPAAEAVPAETAPRSAPAAAEAAGRETSVEAAPVAPLPGASGESTAIPEAVPVAIGSSMTGALQNATDSLPIGDSAAVSTSATADTSTAVAGEQPTGEDLPPARPISGPSGRRKTKRRNTR